MKNDNELMELIEKCLASGLDDLWDLLTPEERLIVFPNYISEWIGANY